tara:strand:+ start:2809 stop:3630 length:822 start_codon:yes stop_codon:yes gene_type:complete
MHVCKTLLNDTTKEILSCSSCRDDCTLLFNHTAFCIQECAIFQATTTQALTTVITSTLAPTILQTTTSTANPVTRTTDAVFINETLKRDDMHTTPGSDVLLNVTAQSLDSHNDKGSSETNVFFFWALISIVFLFLLIAVSIKLFKKKKPMLRRSSRSVLPLESEAIAIEIEPEQNTMTKIEKTVIASVVEKMIQQIERQHALPSVESAAKQLQRMRAAKRKMLRKRRQRQQRLEQLVLRNMQNERQVQPRMRIKEIFAESKKLKTEKVNFDMI